MKNKIFSTKQKVEQDGQFHFKVNAGLLRAFHEVAAEMGVSSSQMMRDMMLHVVIGAQDQNAKLAAKLRTKAQA
jgi:antitoxin component of RelBE/YafQ-DinJ toxin-antitoxin module